MKKRKIIIPAIVCCSMIGAALAAFPVVSHFNSVQVAANYIGEVKNPSSKTFYYIDEEVTVEPKDVVYNNKTYPCSDFYLRYPDGTQKTGSKFRLSQTGEYAVTYIAESGSKIIQAEENIYAYKRAYSVNKDASSSVYVDNIMCEQLQPTGGIQTYLSNGDTWTYNQAIDISKADLNTPIIKYYTRQSSELANHIGIDVLSTVIRLTDFYNEKNYVEIYNTYNETNSSTHRMQPYVTACAYGQIASGIDMNNRSSKMITYEGVSYYLHNSNRAWGACLDTVPGTYGINGDRYDPDIANSDNRGFTLYYNYAKQSLYMKHKTMHIVTDLDEPAIYSNNLFKGFTTGEVILSITCEGYQESHGFFEISEIFGKKGAELNSDYAYDEKAPTITLSNNANNFYIAKGEPFELFTATAKDPHLVGDVSTQVYYDYNTSNQRFVPIVDNKFTPTVVGKYTVVYTAKDTFGNVSTRTVTCNSISAQDNKIVRISFDFDSTAEAGTTVHFNAPQVKGYNEGLYYKVTAINEKNNEVVNLENSDLNLFLKYAGKYTIRVEYGDIATKYVSEYELTSNPSSNAYLKNGTLPKYFIKGAMHSLDDNRVVLVDKDYPTYAESQVFIKNDNNEDYESSPIDTSGFDIEANESVQFKYVYNGKTVKETEKLPVVDVDFGGDFDFASYFVGDLDSKVTGDGVVLSATSNGEQSSEFINPLSFNLLKCEALFNTKVGFKTLDIVMKDYEDGKEKFVISFYFNGSSLCYFQGDINGEIGTVDNLILSYDTSRNILSVGNGVTFSCNNPFENDKLYLSFRATGIELDGAESKDILTIRQINNQVLSDDALGGDYTNAQVYYSKLKGQRNINTTITIKRSSACDVLSPYLLKNHKMTVSYKTSVDEPNSSAEVVSSTDGVALNGSEDVLRDYDVLLDKHGVYMINYTYEDQSYNKVNVTEIIYVNDNEAPEITINGAENGAVETIKLGDEVTIRGYSVKDDSETTVSIYAVSPTNSITKITGKKFKPTEKGDWYIVYYAVDANYNVGTASYIVRVI